MRTARQDLRTAWLGVEAAIQKRDNILQRADTEVMRNTKVKSAILTGASTTSAFEAIITSANSVDVATDSVVTLHPGLVVESALRPAQILAQATQDMDIEDANSEAVVRNLFFDMAEAQGEIDVAAQQYQSMLTQFNGVIGQTGHDVYQSNGNMPIPPPCPPTIPAIASCAIRVGCNWQRSWKSRLGYLIWPPVAPNMSIRPASVPTTSASRISTGTRTADDILKFLQNLDNAVTNLPGGIRDAETNQNDLTISVAQHILGLTDQYLRGQGVADADLQRSAANASANGWRKIPIWAATANQRWISTL
ncbi:MAG: hypothetical protein R2867_19575 [Caldilineaceae bacterium]